MVRNSEIEYLLGSIPLSRFNSDYCSKEFLYVHGETGKFDHLLTINSYLELIESCCFNLAVPSIQMVKLGQYLSSREITLHRYAKGKYSEHRYDYSKIQSKLNDNYNLTFRNIQHSFPKLKKLTKALEVELETQININSYLSPPNSAGLSPHYDTHDIFVLQIYGSKTWEISAPNVTYPIKLDEYRSSSFEAPKNYEQKVIMKKGDLLYVPRGFWHKVTTSDSRSLHLTIGLHSKSNIDFLYWFGAKNEVFRKDVNSMDWKEEIPNLLAQLADQIRQNPKEYLDDFLNHFD